MKRNGVLIHDTFAEAFPMRGTRLVVTAIDETWALHAARSLTGFATSVIACGCEAGIERMLKPSETPDGRPGVAILVFAMSLKALADQVLKRVGQCVMTTPTAACYSGLEGQERVAIGKSLRFFGDGWQISKKIGRERFWRVPVMHGEFVCQDYAGVQKSVGGGNFLVLARTAGEGLVACEKAIRAMSKVRDVIMPFPGGVVGSGSKVGSRYKFLPASTNQLYCPTLKGAVDGALTPDTGSVLEIVIDGLTDTAVAEATRVGVEACLSLGARKGVLAISAGNYGGKLGPFHFHLRELLK